MPQLKAIAQRKFLKGLISVNPKWEQTPGSVPRLSNLLLRARGGLTTCDGSFTFYLHNGSVQTASGPWTELFLFQPVGVQRYYIGVKKELTSQLPAPTGLAVADGGAGGTLANATYKYEVTALDGAGGETTVSNEASFANPGAHKANLTWNPVTNAVSFNVYRTAAGGISGSETLLTTVATTSFTDDGSLSLQPIFPPLVNTTQLCPLYKLPTGSTTYGAGNIIATFPADPIIPVDGTPGGTGGGGGGGGGGGQPPTPTGGNMGNTSPLPQIVQFSNKAVIALGNGFAPQLLTDPSTVAALTNTFTATYPDWQANTTYNQGDRIKPTVNNAGNFVFSATQEGTSGGAAPTFPQTQGQTVADGKVIWSNTGATTTSPAPRGAAHAEVYAGSLWLANTNPTTTTDQLDGPTVLRMSDLNNPNSWNPLNVAFVGRDDGDQITAIKTYTIAAEGISPTGSLVVFKYFKTFQVIGVFGAADFAIQEVRTDMGCIAPRSVAFLPGFGLARLTHLGIAIFDGVNDRLISEEIRPYLFADLNTCPDIAILDQNFAYFSKGGQCADPPMYMLAIPISLANLPFQADVPPGARSVLLTKTDLGPGINNFQTFFFKVTRFTLVNGVSTETDISKEASFTWQNTVRSITVISGNGLIDPAAQKFRLYVGNLSLSYTGFVEITPAQMQAGITLTVPVTTTPGTLAVGAGGLSRILCYDLVLKAWTIIDLPFSISVLKQVRAPGTQPLTISGGFLDGTVRRLQADDSTFDGSAVNWSMRSAEVFGKNAGDRVFYRRLIVRGTTTQTNLAFNVVVNQDGGENPTSPTIIYQQGSQLGVFDFYAQIDIGFSGFTSHVTLSGSGNIQIASLDWDVCPMSEGVPPAL